MRSDTSRLGDNSADSNHADKQIKTKTVQKRSSPKMQCTARLKGRGIRTVFCWSIQVFNVRRWFVTCVREQLSQIICLHTHISRGNQKEKGYRGGGSEYIENIDNDITNNGQCHCTKKQRCCCPSRREVGGLRVSLLASLATMCS